MGDDASRGVVDHKCRVFDGKDHVHSGLYVCDGAIIPRSIGVNPLLTITALTERAMIHFARDHNLGFDADHQAPGRSRTPLPVGERSTKLWLRHG
jgi:cholesterol oxidase